jgi:hypothetical protein
VADSVLQAVPPGHSPSSRRAAVSRAPDGVGYAGRWQDQQRSAGRSGAERTRLVDGLVDLGVDQLSQLPRLRHAVDAALSLVQVRSRDPHVLAHGIHQDCEQMPAEAVVPLAEVELVEGTVELAGIAQSHGRGHPGHQVQMPEAVGSVLAAIAGGGRAARRPGCCRAAGDSDVEEAAHAAPDEPPLFAVFAVCVAGGRPRSAVCVALHPADGVPVLHHQLAPHFPYLVVLLPLVAFGLAVS